MRSKEWNTTMDPVFFSIITPTIGRSSLGKTIRSVIRQDYRHYEHLVVPDVNGYSDYGHSVRRDAVANANGDYILYIDDDDYLADGALSEIARGLAHEGYPTFLFFPTLRMGEVYFYCPPGGGRTTSSQYVHKRVDAQGTLIRFDAGGYGQDSYWIDRMINTYDYALHCCAPLTIVPEIGGNPFTCAETNDRRSGGGDGGADSAAADPAPSLRDSDIDKPPTRPSVTGVSPLPVPGDNDCQKIKIYTMPLDDLPFIKPEMMKQYRPAVIPPISENVETVSGPEMADFIFFPVYLDDLFAQLWLGTSFVAEDWAKIYDFLAGLPLMDDYPEKCVFLIEHDRDLKFDLPCVFMRMSVAKNYKDRNTVALPLRSEDFGPFNAGGGNQYVCTFQGALNTWPHRRFLAEAFKRFGDRLPVSYRPNERFFKLYTPEERAGMRDDYVRLLRASMTICCPRGTGRNSIRFYEALSMGRIPVLISDYAELPFADRIPYDEFVIRVPEHDIVHMADYVMGFFKTFSGTVVLEKMRMARRYWELYLMPSKWADSAVSDLMKIKAARRSAVAA